MKRIGPHDWYARLSTNWDSWKKDPRLLTLLGQVHASTWDFKKAKGYHKSALRFPLFECARRIYQNQKEQLLMIDKSRVSQFRTRASSWHTNSPTNAGRYHSHVTWEYRSVLFWFLGCALSGNRTVEILCWTKNGTDVPMTKVATEKRVPRCRARERKYNRGPRKLSSVSLLSTILYWNHALCQFSSITISSSQKARTRLMPSRIYTQQVVDCIKRDNSMQWFLVGYKVDTNKIQSCAISSTCLPESQLK